MRTATAVMWASFALAAMGCGDPGDEDGPVARDGAAPVDGGGRDAGPGDGDASTDAQADARDAGADARTDAAAADARTDTGMADASTAADADARTDAAAADARTDTGMADASTAADAGPPDGGSCNESAIRYAALASGPLMEGTLCDEVWVCLRDPSQAASILAASPRFVCDGPPGSGCSGGRCFYRNPGGPGLIDASELAEICAVTRVTPTPEVVCIVYGP